MRLLVSVASAVEAAAAVAGGADIVDAKDPRRGALGAVALPVFTSICERVDGAVPVSAAAGDASDETSIEEAAREFTAAGASFVKVGFAGIRTDDHVRRLLGAALHGSPDVIAVAYADWTRAATVSPDEIIDAARDVGARGVLIDTADKRSAGLCDVATPLQIEQWVRTVRAHGLLAAIAGKLTLLDIPPLLFRTAADIVGVRGAACHGGRLGSVSELHVRALRDQITSCAAVS